ncbi:MAG: tetratricopeptide repeat protein [Cyclobacteriaceae bacterium]|nr:tetratricopeptide repeat protein [Cyclobacteriaceae bacterium]
MTGEKLLQRARFFLEQKRFEDAEVALRQILGDEPANAEVLVLLALCLKEKGDHSTAVQVIQQAIAANAGYDPAYYIYSVLLFRNQKIEEARKQLDIAISINPFHAEYFGMMAQIHLVRKQFLQAFEVARKGLAIDPDNINCLNVQTTALVKLNRKDEARQSIEKALEKDPENAHTHANVGWSLLEKNDPEPALEHFKKSLQLDPQSEYAKAGMVEAMKAKYLPYRLFLRYAFWMSKLRGTYQWLVIIGFYLFYRLLSHTAQQMPQLQMVIYPFLILLLLVAVSTWIIVPLSNLFLRFNLYGRYALTREDTISSTWVGLALVTGLLSLLIYVISQFFVLMALAIYAFTMMIPLSHMFSEKRKKQNWRLPYVIALGMIGALAVVNVGINEETGPALSLYILGLLGFQLLVNVSASRNS